MPLSIIWGETDNITKRSLMMDIYNNANQTYQQFIELSSYPDQKADHMFPSHKKSFLGGIDGVSAFHYHGTWKWLLGAAADIANGSRVTNSYIYGDRALTSGDESVLHKAQRSW